MPKKAKKKAPATADPAGPAKKVGLPKPAGGDALELSGRVKSWRMNRHDDVDGLILADGTEVRFPPHLADDVSGVVQRDDKVRIIARSHVSPQGETHLHAVRIENAETGRVVTAGIPRGKKKHTKKHAKKHARRHHPPGHSPPHEQMLAEIRAIRALLADRQRPRPEDDRPPHEQVLRELRELRSRLEHDS